MTDNEKPLSTLAYYQPIEPADIEEIEGMPTPKLIEFLSREFFALGLGLEELSRRMAKALGEGRRQIAPVNGRQITSAASLPMELF